MLLVSELHQTLPTCLLEGATSYKLAESLAHQGQQQDWIPVVGIFRHPYFQKGDMFSDNTYNIGTVHKVCSSHLTFDYLSQLVILSSCHLVNLSSNHPVIMPSFPVETVVVRYETNLIVNALWIIPQH